MDKEEEQQEAQTNPEGGVTQEVVSISKKEFEDIKHKAEVSSQNFERLKKLEKEKAELEAELKTKLVEQPLIENSDELVGKLRTEVAGITQRLQKSEVIETYPQLKGIWEEFENFRNLPENAGMSMMTASKAFVIEKGLLEPKRKGLEKPTGGDRQPILSTMSHEEIKKLRETNYKKYVEMLKKGQIKA